MIIPGLIAGGAAANDPIFYVGGKTASATGSGAFTIDVGSGLTGGISSSAATDDFLVAVFQGTDTGAASVDTESGTWTEGANLLATDTQPSRLLLGYGFVNGDTTLTFNPFASTHGKVICAQVWRNVDKSTPLDVALQTNTQTNTVLADPPAITPITAGAKVIAMAAGGHAYGTLAYSHSGLDNVLSKSVNSGSYDAAGAMGSHDWVSGAYNPAAFSFPADDTGFACCSVTMALRPANPG